MNSRFFDRNDFFILVSGFDKDTDRGVFKSEFDQFGVVKKIFVENTGKYAKIYFNNIGSCTRALHTFKNNPYNWKVEFVPDKEEMKFLEYNCSKVSEDMDDEGDFTEKFGYCTIHGQPIVVLQAESGDLYVKLKDVRRAGFQIFRKDTFSHLLVEKEQINKEFELHLLSEAKNYILNNKVATLDEEQILKTIERCKNKLVGENSSNPSLITTPGRSVVSTSNNNFQITTDLQNISNGQIGDTNTLTSMQRSPKTQPANFIPNKNVQDNRHPRSQSRGRQSSGNQASERPSLGNQERGPPSLGNQERGRPNLGNQERGRHSFGNETSGRQSLTNSTSDRQNFNKENRPRNSADKDFGSSTKPTGHISSSNSTCSSENSSRKQTPKINPNIEEETISSLSLIPGESYKVKVCFIESEKICWVQEAKSSEALDDMTLEILEIEPKLEVLEHPRMGQLVIAFYEELWFRARVVNEEPLLVHYLDYGNQYKPALVKPLPEKCKKTPALACRMVVNHVNGDLSDELEMIVKIKKQYTDGTYLTQMVSELPTAQPLLSLDIKRVEAQGQEQLLPSESLKLNVDNKKLESHTDKVYFDMPLQLAKLQDGEMVIICGVLDGNKLLVKTKDCCKRSKELLEYIKKLDKSILTMTSVKKNQLVLCSKDGMVGLYRATVTIVDNETVATVKYIDYPGEDQLSIKSLRNVDEYLAKQPALLIETPVCKGLVDAVPAAVEYVSQLIEDKTKVTVVLSNDTFDLKLDEGKLLSDKLNNINNPKRVMTEAPKLIPVETKEDKIVLSKITDVENLNKIPPEINQVQECKSSSSKGQPLDTEYKTMKIQDKTSEVGNGDVYVPVTFDDMDWIKPNIGKNDYICYTIKDLSDITLISLEEDSIKFMEKISELEPTDDRPLKPGEMEMCIVSHQTPEDESACWYRAAVLSVADEEFTLLLVDFGNQITATKNSIRRLPESMKCIPILGISCACIGIPHTDKVFDALKNQIQEGTQVEVDIKEYSEDDLKYNIEFPIIYECLRKDGLCK